MSDRQKEVTALDPKGRVRYGSLLGLMMAAGGLSAEQVNGLLNPNRRQQYTGEELREIRKKNGVGRPRKKDVDLGHTEPQ